MRSVPTNVSKGSQNWLQVAVERTPALLQPSGLATLEWLSPRKADDNAEYRDAAFLKVVGLEHLADALRDFWPRRGPQWDGLARTADGGVVLVEAKAHLREFASSPSAASPKSRKQIVAALDAARAGLGAEGGGDWSRIYYQYANRLAHLWWLRQQGVAAHLLLVGFVGDTAMGGPADPSVWAKQYTRADRELGLPEAHPLAAHVWHVHPDVRQIG